MANSSRLPDTIAEAMAGGSMRQAFHMTLGVEHQDPETLDGVVVTQGQWWAL